MADVQVDEVGRPEPPPAADEVETLLGFLDFQRATLAWKCAGLDDEQLRTRLQPTTMTLAGLLKHLARVEDGWFTRAIGEVGMPAPWTDLPWSAEWESSAVDTGDELRRLWEERIEASRRVVSAALAAGADALDATHPTGHGDERVSLRWVLVHMIEEYARHNGHADLLRQAVDGQTGE